MQQTPPKTHKTAVVIIPPEEVWSPIQAIRQEYDRHVRRWMPHITMIYPFRPKEQFEALAEEFRAVCQAIAPFELQFVHFRFFSHGRQQYTLWLTPEPVDPVIELQTALWQVVPDCDDTRKFKHGFTPHLSVGQVRGKAQMEALSGQLQSRWQPLAFTVKEVNLIWRNQPPDDVFRVGRKVHIGNKSA
jgi:2'-5' RNA ligase